MPHVTYNVERLNIYRAMFTDVLCGGCGHDTEAANVATNLLFDIRWPEVSRAFVDCLVAKSVKNGTRPLVWDIERLVARTAVFAFGTRAHAEIPSWFLQNCECFLASSLHKLLADFTHRPPTEARMRWAFGALFDAAEGLKSFVGLRYIGASTGAHALMSAVANAKYDFLKEEHGRVSRPALLFVGMLAERIMSDPNRALEVQSAFCFFARSDRWRTFAAACDGSFATDEAFSSLQRELSDAMLRKAPEEGLFFIAREFLEADASPDRPVRNTRARAAATLTKTAPTTAISKRSTPFLRLVKRLVADEG